MIIWAKLSPDRSRHHPLHAHSADVAAVVEQLILPGSPLAARLAAALGVVELHPWHAATFVFLAALHDIGKTNHGFQERGSEKPRYRRRGHVKVLLESGGCKPLAAAIRDALAYLDVSGTDARELLSATVGHHGRPWPHGQKPDLNELWLPDPNIPRDPIAEIRRITALALRWSGLSRPRPVPPLKITPALTHLFSGILTLADWIASTEAAFAFAPDADPASYFEAEARPRAARACASIGVVGRSLDLHDEGAVLLSRMFPFVFTPASRREPTPLQLYVASEPLPSPGSLILAESDTGSGKTELALLLFARLRVAGVVGGLAFLLPTRASAKAMHDRIVAALPGIYGERLPTVALAVGGRQPQAVSTSPALNAEPIVYDDAPEEHAADLLAGWASEGAKRFMAAEIVIGTLDQVLLGALPVRHAHMRLAAATRHLLVVDELHSYDRYMTGVLAGLLKVHTDHGGIALLMSATLAAAARREFGSGDSPAITRAQAQERPYPSLSVCDAGECWRDIALRSTAIPKTISWRLTDLAEGLVHAAHAADQGARVCVLRNTVRGARAAVAALREAGYGQLLWSPRPGATPAYHSRYAPQDRGWLDGVVVETFGRRGSASGVILASTQVAEQSLDIDFDVLVTDLCPIDVLLQRIGRLWRHGERRRATVCKAATALVIAPPDGLQRYVESGSGPDGWGTVYPDLIDLELTLQLIHAESDIEIPRDNRRLVEAVFHEEARARFSDGSWERYRDAREGVDFATVAHARQSIIHFGETYGACYRQFDAAAEAKIRTRLGDDQIRVPLSHPVRCRYAEDAVEFVDLPEHVVLGAAAESPLQAILRSDGEYEFGTYSLVYDDDGWRWEKNRYPG